MQEEAKVVKQPNLNFGCFTPTGQIELDDRRRHERFEPPIGRAFIYLGARIPLVECDVVNVSEGGAKIHALDYLLLPSHFVLFFTLDGSQRRTCRVIWRDGPNTGVSFTDDHWRSPVFKNNRV
jgi:hypothetical protein